MADVKVTSAQYSLNWLDVLKGAIIAVVMVVLTPIEEALRTGGKVDWTVVGGAAASAFFAYLVKNFFTPATVQKTISNSEVADVKAANSVNLVIK